MYVYAVIRSVDDYPENGGGNYTEAICATEEKAINLCEELAKEFGVNATNYTWRMIKVLE